MTPHVSTSRGGPDPEVRPASRRIDPLRSREALESEITELRSRLGTMPNELANHPRTLRTIAADLAELSCVARVNGDHAMEESLRAQARTAFATLEQDHAGVAPIDETLFFLAHLYERAGDLTSARETYRSLASLHPTSQLVPEAWVAIGDIRYDESEQVNDRGQRAEAKEAYEEALSRIRPLDGVDAIAGYAWYRLAWAREKDGDRDGAVAAFRSARDSAATRVDDSDASRIVVAAQRELDAILIPP